MAWMAWLILAAALIQYSEMPDLISAALGVLVLGAGGFISWRFVFLRGARALRSVEWQENGEGGFLVELGRPGRRLAAIPEGCRRHAHLWLLRFQTGEGVVQALVDARRQQPRPLRRLARRLFRDSGTGEGLDPAEAPRGTDTIRAKV